MCVYVCVCSAKENRWKNILLKISIEVIIMLFSIIMIIVDFAVPADHRVKIKENKKRNKKVDLARELKNL